MTLKVWHVPWMFSSLQSACGPRAVKPEGGSAKTVASSCRVRRKAWNEYLDSVGLAGMPVDESGGASIFLADTCFKSIVAEEVALTNVSPGRTAIGASHSL